MQPCRPDRAHTYFGSLNFSHFATRDFTVKTVQKAADLAVHTGSRLYTDSASSYRALKGYVHDFVNHTQKEYARGDVHENRAECLFSLLKPCGCFGVSAKPTCRGM